MISQSYLVFSGNLVQSYIVSKQLNKLGIYFHVSRVNAYDKVVSGMI